MNIKTKKAALYLDSGFLPCDIDMHRECTCEVCQKDIGGLLSCLVNSHVESLTTLNTLWNAYIQLPEEQREVVRIETNENSDVTVIGPEEWIDRLISFRILDSIKEKKDQIEDILNKPI